MNFIKMTTSGQVTIPKQFRKHFDTDVFICNLENEAVVFRPVEVKRFRKRKAKYTMKDFLAFTFEGKNPKESLVDQIDHIVYGI